MANHPQGTEKSGCPWNILMNDGVDIGKIAGLFQSVAKDLVLDTRRNKRRDPNKLQRAFDCIQIRLPMEQLYVRWC